MDPFFEVCLIIFLACLYQHEVSPFSKHNESIRPLKPALVDLPAWRFYVVWMAAFYHSLALSTTYHEYFVSEGGSWIDGIMGLNLVIRRISETVFLVAVLEIILGGVAIARANVTKDDLHEESFKDESFSSGRWIFTILSTTIPTAFMLPWLVTLLFL